MLKRGQFSQLSSESSVHLDIRPMQARDRDSVVERLSRKPLENLLLIDAASKVGEVPSTGDPAVQVLLAECEDRLVGVAALQPIVTVEFGISEAVLAELLPHLGAVSSGLLKTRLIIADSVWPMLESSGRRKVLDRIEQGYAVSGRDLRPYEVPGGGHMRSASAEDLPDLVDAARSSLKEEDRRDPFDGNPYAFRGWVASRLPRARVIDFEGELCFVGYADVQLESGWLLQGVYTPGPRRRSGFAAAGVSDLCRCAFSSGASHVQLAVVQGNKPAEELYRKLGFRETEQFRTILFR